MKEKEKVKDQKKAENKAGEDVKDKIKKILETKYNIQIVLNNGTEKINQYTTSLYTVIVFMAAAVLLILGVLSYSVTLARELKQTQDNELMLNVQLKTMTSQNELLIEQRVELQEKISILSNTLNSKVQQEEQREAEIAKTYIPSGFPLKGKAAYDENQTKLDDNPIAMFHAASGISVIATANGTVSKIEGNYADGYIVTVDHGNGYFTIYRNGAEPRVKEGSEVTRETEIFKIETGNGDIGYQIMENDKYIDPLSLMEISG